MTYFGSHKVSSIGYKLSLLLNLTALGEVSREQGGSSYDNPVISRVQHDEEGGVGEDGDCGREEDDSGLGVQVDTSGCDEPPVYI